MNVPAFTSQIRPTSGWVCSALLSQSILLVFAQPLIRRVIRSAGMIADLVLISRCYTLRPLSPSFAAERSLGRGHGEPGVDDERLPRDPACFVAGQVDGAPSDVPAGALGTKWACAPPALPGRVAE